MTDQLVISAIGEDRPGIVNDLSDIIFKLSLNIEDSRMSVLGGEFAIQLLVSGDQPAIAALQAQLGDIESRLGLNIMARPTRRRVVSERRRTQRPTSRAMFGMAK